MDRSIPIVAADACRRRRNPSRASGASTHDGRVSDDTLQQARADTDKHGVAWALEELRLAEARLDRRRQGRAPTSRDRAATRWIFERDDLGDPATPSELAEHLGISPSTASELIARLVGDGIIATRQHPHDRRSKVLSPMNRNDHLEGDDALTDEIRTAVARLTDDQAVGVRDFLDHLRELVDRAEPR